jgi:hypothetical protein
MPESISKMSAVRQAISDLGKHASPAAIQDFVKSRFQLSMTTGHISNYKSTILKGKGKRRGRPKSASGPRGKPAPASRDRNVGVKVQEILSLRAMVGRVGADDLKALIDLVSN